MKAFQILIFSVLTVASITSTNAFCISNLADTEVTCFVSHDTDGGSWGSFKKSFNPGDNKCCNWQDRSCNKHGIIDHPLKSYCLTIISQAWEENFTMIAGGSCEIIGSGGKYYMKCLDQNGHQYLPSISPPLPPSTTTTTSTTSTTSTITSTISNSIPTIAWTFGGSSCESVGGIEKYGYGRYYGWKIYPRCVIANPPEVLPANWTYNCTSIPPDTNGSSYFSYPDGSPCSCDDGCEDYLVTSSPTIDPQATTSVDWSTYESQSTSTPTSTSTPESVTILIDTTDTNDKMDAPNTGRIQIDGPEGSLSHMNEKSGWKILGCQKHPHPQTLLVYCTSNDSLVCQHVFHKGAEHTIVTLPNGCGSSLFARVASLKPTSKPLPKSERQNLEAKEILNIKLYELKIDYEFNSIPTTNGSTSIQMDFSNIPAYNATEDSKFNKLNKRGWLDWLSSISKVTVKSSTTLDVSQTFEHVIFKDTQVCPGFTSSMQVVARGGVNTRVKYGYRFVGTLVPPNIIDHYVYLDVNPSIGCSLEISGRAEWVAGYQFPLIPIFEVPGLAYKPIVSFSPYISMNGEIDGYVEISGSFVANFTYNFPPIHMALGGSEIDMDNNTLNEYSPGNGGNSQLSAGVELDAGLSLSIIPVAGLRFSILSGLIDGRVFLEGDGTISAKTSLQANLTGQQACFELDSFIALNWGLYGNLGKWSTIFKDNIFSAKDQLWKKCFKSSDKNPKALLKSKQIAPIASNIKKRSLCPEVIPSCPITNGTNGTFADMEAFPQRFDTNIIYTLKNHNDEFYILSLEIGSRKYGRQSPKYDLHIDTGSIELWVTDNNCRNRHVITHYNPCQSKAAKIRPGTFDCSYGGVMSVKGYYVTDKVRIESQKVEMEFAVVGRTCDDYFETMSDHHDGIVGLGFQDERSPRQRTYLSYLKEVYDVPQIFGLYLGHYPNNGEMKIGDWDRRRVSGPIQYVSVVQSIPQYWFVMLRTLSINGVEILQGQRTPVLIDSGSVATHFPPDIVARYYQQIGSAEQDEEGEFYIPCSFRNPQNVVEYGFRDTNNNPIKIKIHYQDLIYGRYSNTMCIGPVVERVSNIFNVLGTLFMKSAYLIFDADQKRIGMVQVPQ